METVKDGDFSSYNARTGTEQADLSLSNGLLSFPGLRNMSECKELF